MKRHPSAVDVFLDVEGVGVFAEVAAGLSFCGGFLILVNGLLRWVFGGGLGLSEADGGEEVGC